MLLPKANESRISRGRQTGAAGASRARRAVQSAVTDKPGDCIRQLDCQANSLRRWLERYGPPDYEVSFSRSTTSRKATPTAGKQTVRGMSEFMNCSRPSSVLRSAPVNPRQVMSFISASKRRRNSCATANLRSPSSIVSAPPNLRPIAITAPATAPQTAPVLPIPPAKPKAIRGMISFSVSISNSWHTARSTASDQT